MGLHLKQQQRHAQLLKFVLVDPGLGFHSRNFQFYFAVTMHVGTNYLYVILHVPTYVGMSVLGTIYCRYPCRYVGIKYHPIIWLSYLNYLNLTVVASVTKFREDMNKMMPSCHEMYLKKWISIFNCSIVHLS